MANPRDAQSRLDLSTPLRPRDYVFVIAEIGINHNGDVKIARELVDVAAEAGCDAVKFQKRSIEVVYDEAALRAPRDSPWGTTQRAQKEGLEFDLEEYRLIADHCRARQIPWTASAWDLDSLAFVEAFDPPFHKIASAMVTHEEFVEAVAALGRPTLISTGMCDLGDIDAAVEVFRRSGTSLGLMHSVSTYPAAENHLNLTLIPALEARYGLPVGYSGHEPSVSPSVVAAALGARFVERHITLDRSMYGSDQSASLEPQGLRHLVSTLRKLPGMLGDGQKKWAPGEKDVARKLRYWESYE